MPNFANMTITDFVNRIETMLGFAPTADQHMALTTFGRFLALREAGAVMVMRGSAGTGKTALAGAMVRTMNSLGQKLCLMAPTGRAAKVLSSTCDLPAYTIHRRIYREKSYQGLDGAFALNNNLSHNTLFVVDEASMVSDIPGEGSFGSGNLLDDLLQYVYSGDNCRLLLIGDSAQLPPVGAEESPALSADVLQGYRLTVFEANLNEVVRQEEESGILYNATALRHLVERMDNGLPRIRFHGFADVVNLRGDQLVEAISDSYAAVGADDTIVITRSNKRANIYNQGIRNTVLEMEDRLSGGDLIMVVRNNYYWMERDTSDGQKPPVAFLANGDIARVIRVRRTRELYGFTFCDVLVAFPDYNHYETELTVLLDALNSEAPALTREQHEQLFNEVMADYADISLKTERMKQLRQDAHFNAVQIKFAYAVTCHKAQGGQWSHVYIDQGYMTDEMVTPEYGHWLYTAITRATEKVYMVNWPTNQVEEAGGDEVTSTD